MKPGETVLVCGRVGQQSLPSDFVDCIVTSPPYFGLRNYGVTGQMGQEKSPAEYVANMARLFREARWFSDGDASFCEVKRCFKNQVCK